MAERVLPYKVVATGPGRAAVVARASLGTVGEVRRAFGQPGWRPVLCLPGAPSFPMQVVERTRADAARAVWEASRG